MSDLVARPCRLCGARILFIPQRDPTKPKHPVDPKLHPMITTEGQVVHVYRSHFATCPRADEARKSKSNGDTKKKKTTERRKAEKVPECWWCGSPAGLLCDKVIGWTEDAHGTVQQHTCDAPICDACTSVVGSGVVCRRKPKGCDEFRMDYCPRHVDTQGDKTLAGLEAIQAERQATADQAFEARMNPRKQST